MKLFDLVCAAHKERRPASQVEKLVHPILLSKRVSGFGLTLGLVLVPVIVESRDPNVVLALDSKRGALLVVGIAVSMRDA